MKQQISSTKAPKALGPYSAGVATEGLVFLSGQLGADTNGNLVSEDVVEQTRKAFENIKKNLITDADLYPVFNNSSRTGGDT